MFFWTKIIVRGLNILEIQEDLHMHRETKTNQNLEKRFFKATPFCKD